MRARPRSGISSHWSVHSSLHESRSVPRRVIANAVYPARQPFLSTPSPQLLNIFPCSCPDRTFHDARPRTAFLTARLTFLSLQTRMAKICLMSEVRYIGRVRIISTRDIKGRGGKKGRKKREEESWAEGKGLVEGGSIKRKESGRAWTEEYLSWRHHSPVTVVCSGRKEHGPWC